MCLTKTGLQNLQNDYMYTKLFIESLNMLVKYTFKYLLMKLVAN